MTPPVFQYFNPSTMLTKAFCLINYKELSFQKCPQILFQRNFSKNCSNLNKRNKHPTLQSPNEAPTNSLLIFDGKVFPKLENMLSRIDRIFIFSVLPVKKSYWYGRCTVPQLLPSLLSWVRIYQLSSTAEPFLR